MLGLAFLVRRRQPGYGLVAGALALAGLIGLAAVITIDGFAWGIAGELADQLAVGARARRGGAAATSRCPSGRCPYYLAPLGFIVGMLMLAVGVARQGAVPGWAGGLLALAVLMVGTETAIVSNAYFITGAAVFLVAGIAVALPLLRMSDEQFAQGSS